MSIAPRSSRAELAFVVGAFGLMLSLAALAGIDAQARIGGAWPSYVATGAYLASVACFGYSLLRANARGTRIRASVVEEGDGP